MKDFRIYLKSKTHDMGTTMTLNRITNESVINTIKEFEARNADFMVTHYQDEFGDWIEVKHNLQKALIEDND